MTPPKGAVQSRERADAPGTSTPGDVVSVSAGTALAPAMRRKPAEWMKPADDRILELLAIDNERLWLPPKAIYRNISVGENWVHKRLAVLLSADLIERDRGAYRITDAGLQYLSGDLDASNLSPD